MVKRGEQCEDECPSDHYVDELRKECFPCHEECRGCTGPGPNNCNECRQLKLYFDDPPINSTAFNCTNICPPSHSYKKYTDDQLGPYCSVEEAYFLGDTAETPLYTIGLLIGLFVIFVFASILFYFCNQRSKDSKEAVKMTKVLCEDSEPLRPSNVGPNLSKLRIIKEQELRRGGRLGMGAFGAVYKGVWIVNENNKLPVAIKIPLEMSGPQASKDFLEEAYIMASVDHPNLLNLLAVCMTSEMMFVTQLMPLGSLLDYVKTNKDRTGSKALLNWSTQIARGMAYLEERRLVHRDLAARNVLVRNASLVKITDFGLAKLLSYDCDEYKAAGGKMPIKWLALECIRNRVFTSKSDVWAFGVTIWELLTFGKRPYGDHPAKDVPDLIEVGYKLEQPEICSLDVYIQLVGCWNLDAGLRPSFKDLVEVFSGYARDPGRYLYVPGDKHMRLPSFTSQDEKDLIRNLPTVSDTIQETDEYLQPKQSHSMHGGHHHTIDGCDTIPDSLRYCGDPMMMSAAGNDECDNTNRKVCVDNLKLDLPLDEDDYLMPTCQSQAAAGGYMDLIGVPICVDNPEYLIGSAAALAAAAKTSSVSTISPPTQTIGIPLTNVIATVPKAASLTSLPATVSVLPSGSTSLPGLVSATALPNVVSEGEQSSDHEYYNDLQRELQPLHRSETTV